MAKTDWIKESVATRLQSSAMQVISNSPSDLILFVAYAVQHSVQNLWEQARASVRVWVSSKQIGQTKGPSTESDFFDLEDAGAVRRVDREGPEVVDRGEVGLAVTPASALTPVGLSIYFSVTFSLFHSKCRKRIEATSGCGTGLEAVLEATHPTHLESEESAYVRDVLIHGILDTLL